MVPPGPSRDTMHTIKATHSARLPFSPAHSQQSSVVLTVPVSFWDNEAPQKELKVSEFTILTLKSLKIGNNRFKHVIGTKYGSWALISKPISPSPNPTVQFRKAGPRAVSSQPAPVSWESWVRTRPQRAHLTQLATLTCSSLSHLGVLIANSCLGAINLLPMCHVGGPPS